MHVSTEPLIYVGNRVEKSKFAFFSVVANAYFA